MVFAFAAQEMNPLSLHRATAAQRGQTERRGVIRARLTFICPCSEGAVVVDDVDEGEGQDEEGAVAGGVHAEGHVPLIQTDRLPGFGQRRLEEFPRHLARTTSKSFHI